MARRPFTPEQIHELRCFAAQWGKSAPDASSGRMALAAATGLIEDTLRTIQPQAATLGEFNARVKGKQKFWNRPAGADAVLQVRAAYSSEDGRLELCGTPRQPLPPTDHLILKIHRHPVHDLEPSGG